MSLKIIEVLKYFQLETSTPKYSSIVSVPCCINTRGVPSQDPSSPRGSPAHSPRENGLDKARLLKKDAPISPASIASSSSTPSSKSKELSLVSGSSSVLVVPVSGWLGLTNFLILYFLHFSIGLLFPNVCICSAFKFTQQQCFWNRWVY